MHSDLPGLDLFVRVFNVLSVVRGVFRLTSCVCWADVRMHMLIFIKSEILQSEVSLLGIHFCLMVRNPKTM